MGSPRHRHDRVTGVVLGVVLVSLAAMLGCGGNVVVDAGQGGAGGSAATTSTGPDPCEPTGEGTGVQGCLPMDGDTCPPQSSSIVLTSLAGALGVCAEMSPGVCCNEPALTEILCELPPTSSQCCYVAQLEESGVCLGD